MTTPTPAPDERVLRPEDPLALPELYVALSFAVTAHGEEGDRALGRFAGALLRGRVYAAAGYGPESSVDAALVEALCRKARRALDEIRRAGIPADAGFVRGFWAEAVGGLLYRLRSQLGANPGGLTDLQVQWALVGCDPLGPLPAGVPTVADLAAPGGGAVAGVNRPGR